MVALLHCVTATRFVFQRHWGCDCRLIWIIECIFMASRLPCELWHNLNGEAVTSFVAANSDAIGIVITKHFTTRDSTWTTSSMCDSVSQPNLATSSWSHSSRIWFACSWRFICDTSWFSSYIHAIIGWGLWLKERETLHGVFALQTFLVILRNLGAHHIYTLENVWTGWVRKSLPIF